MTAVIHRIFAFYPTLLAPLMSVQKQVHNALAPWEISHTKSPEVFAFLATAPTAKLTPEMTIEYFWNHQFEPVAIFIVSRKGLPFRRFVCSPMLFFRIQAEMMRNGGRGCIPAYEYVLDKDHIGGPLAFPDFTEKIFLNAGSLLNVPKCLKELTLGNVKLTEAISEEIGRSTSLRRLEYRQHTGIFQIHGLPPNLRCLIANVNLTFLGGYRYDCPELHTLHVHNLDNVTLEPGPRLTSLCFRCGSPSKLVPFFKKATNLLTLRTTGHQLFDLSMLSPTICEINSNFSFTVSDPTTCFPNVKRLTIITNEWSDNVLAAFPNLEHVGILYQKWFTGFKGVYTNVKSAEVCFDTVGFTTADVLATFPNLQTLRRNPTERFNSIPRTYNYRDNAIELEFNWFRNVQMDLSEETIVDYVFTYTNSGPDRGEIVITLPLKAETVTIVYGDVVKKFIVRLVKERHGLDYTPKTIQLFSERDQVYLRFCKPDGKMVGNLLYSLP